MTARRCAARSSNARTSGPRKIVIFDGTAAPSAPHADRGTPWYSPNSPRTPTDASWSGVASSSITIATLPSRSRNGRGSASIASPIHVSKASCCSSADPGPSSGCMGARIRTQPGAAGEVVPDVRLRPGPPGTMPPVTLAPNDFVHLHTHSEFSLLDGLGRITDLVDTAQKHGFDSLAIADHGALYGAVAFYQAATKAGIKPIIGVETYVARRSMRDKEGKADAQPFHLVLLATDMTGYRNLCRLVTDAHLDGHFYKLRIDREHLARHSAGLVSLSACLNGEIARALDTDEWARARRIAGEYGEIFCRDRFYLELQDHVLAEQRRLNEQLLRLAPETGLPLVVTKGLHYVHR